MSAPTTLVECAARAMCVAEGHDPDGDPYDYRDAGLLEPLPAHWRKWHRYIPQVRTVLQAMRDASPSKAMIEALFAYYATTAAEPQHEESVIKNWRILLDAALKEGT